jgi:hypothetical protein
MTVVSNDPIWWPAISYNRVYSYFSGAVTASKRSHSNFDNGFSVVSFTVVLYDWGEPCNAYERNVDIPTTPALTFGQEVV